MNGDKIWAVSIIFGDNDFGTTFEFLLQSIREVIKYRGGYITQDYIEKIIHQGIWYHYFTFQRNDYTANKQTEEFLMNYLQDIRILFNEEAYKSWELEDHDSGAWYLNMEENKVYPY